MEVRTYTSDFERVEMNMLAEHFPEGIHVECLFNLKQAWVKYLGTLAWDMTQSASRRLLTWAGWIFYVSYVPEV